MSLELMVSVMPVKSGALSAFISVYKHRQSEKIMTLYHAALDIHQWYL